MKKTITLLLLFTTSVFFSQVPSYVPTNGLVGWWPFTGNANDLSGNGNNGTNNGASLTSDRFGNSNQAFSFNGLNNYISISNNNTTNPTSITINLWLKVNSIPTNLEGGAFALVSKWYSITNCSSLSDSYILNLGKINNQTEVITATNLYSQSNLFSNSSNLDYVNSWNNITFVHDNNIGGKIYINGVLISSNSIIGNICSTSNSVFFGASQNLGTLWRFLNGNLDDIGIWNRALTQQEITNLYNASLSTEDFAINTIDIYPNPTTSLLNFKSVIQVEKILIYNMLGQLVQQEKVNALEGTINIEKLVQGTYLVKVNDIDKGYTIIKN